jgi:hypothetical protein
MKVKLPGQLPAAELVTPPWPGLPAYKSCPARISIVTVPPLANVMTPACTAAMQTDEWSA